MTAAEILAAIQALKVAMNAINQLAAIGNAKGEISDSELATIEAEGLVTDTEMADRVAAEKKRLGK